MEADQKYFEAFEEFSDEHENHFSNTVQKNRVLDVYDIFRKIEMPTGKEDLVALRMKYGDKKRVGGLDKCQQLLLGQLVSEAVFPDKDCRYTLPTVQKAVDSFESNKEFWNYATELVDTRTRHSIFFSNREMLVQDRNGISIIMSDPIMYIDPQSKSRYHPGFECDGERIMFDIKVLNESNKRRYPYTLDILKHAGLFNSKNSAKHNSISDSGDFTTRWQGENVKESMSTFGSIWWRDIGKEPAKELYISANEPYRHHYERNIIILMKTDEKMFQRPAEVKKIA